MATLDQLHITDSERELFLEETNEHLERLESGLLKLEQGENTPELLAEIFRSAHTIKGAAATLGLEDMTNLTHVMESRLDMFRSGKDVPTSETIDALLAATDGLKQLARALAADETADVAVKTLVNNLEQETDIDDNTDDNADVTPCAPKPASPGANWQVVTRISSDCPMPAVRSLQVLLALEEIGNITGSVPDRNEIEAEKVTDQLTVWLDSEAVEAEIAASLASVPEIDGVDITGVTTTTEQITETTTDTQTDQTTVRINVGILDDLMNLVGELVIGRGRLSAIGEELAAQTQSSNASEELTRLSTHLARVTGSIQDAVLKARMLPISRVFQRLPRLVRDLSRQQEKQVELTIQGEDTELDRSVLELLGDPLIHLVRNSLDHGIESPQERQQKGKPASGHIEITASHEESRVVISIKDDGKGLDPDTITKTAIKRNIISSEAASELSQSEVFGLIFAPGFSTASKVTEVSGRGVGMDVVKRNIEQAGGRVEVDSEPGIKTCIRLVLPLTLATLRVLLLNTGGEIMAAPLSTIQETLRVTRDEIRTVGKKPHTLVRNDLIPLLWLQDLYEPEQSWEDRVNGNVTVVLAKHSTGIAGIVVDRLLGEQEVVIKRLGEAVGSIPGIGGATILGNGDVALILDVPGAVRELSLS